MAKYALIVDDDNDIRDSVIGALDFEGFKAYGAENGRAALDILTPEFIEGLGCIILDMMMPEMSGIDFLEEVKTNRPDLRKIPIIIATAKGSPVIHDSIPGSMRKLKKPFDLEELTKIIENFCGDK